MPLIRARDLRANISAMGFEKGVVYTLERALEEQAEMRQHIIAVAELCNQCMDELGKLIAIGGQMKQTVERLHRDIKGNVDGEQS